VYGGSYGGEEQALNLGKNQALGTPKFFTNQPP